MSDSRAALRWVGTWAAAPQLTEPGNLPPIPLAHRTLRQVVYVSVGGSRARVRFSNEYGNGPLSLKAVELETRPLAFSGSPSVTVPAGATITSDPLDFSLAARTKLTVTMTFAETPDDVTGHPGSRTTSYILDAGETVPVEHWYYLTGIDVEASADTRAVAIIGDSLTDGRGSTTDGNDRWPDVLSRRLRDDPATSRVAVLNLGLGGNAVVSGGLGPTARARFSRDVLSQSGVHWVIVLHGVNDIGPGENPSAAQDLIGAYQEFIAAAHARGLRVYGATLLPFGGSQYDSPRNEDARQTVNAWIRHSSGFDAVLDTDLAVSDPSRPTRLLPAYDCGDHLHLNPAGYERLASTVDLALFRLAGSGNG